MSKDFKLLKTEEAMIKTIFSALVVVLLFSACGKEQYDAEIGYEQAMLNYMEAQGWDGYKKEGIYVVMDNPGTGAQPTPTTEVRVNYKGYYTDDEKFDGNDNIQFKLNQVIPGWRIGMTEFARGGKGHLLIPPSLAYGEEPSNSIRPRSVLIFDIELLDF